MATRSLFGERAEGLIDIGTRPSRERPSRTEFFIEVDSGAAGPLSDMLEEDGQTALAAILREPHSMPFFLRVCEFLYLQHFDAGSMEVVVTRPPFNGPAPRWLAWKSIEFSAGHWRRVAMVMKGGAR